MLDSFAMMQPRITQQPPDNLNESNVTSLDQVRVIKSGINIPILCMLLLYIATCYTNIAIATNIIFFMYNVILTLLYDIVMHRRYNGKSCM